MVDSTSILKDSRHPSHTHLGQGGAGQIHRVVSLNRTHSMVDRNGGSPRRRRFYSASERDPSFSKHSSFCNLTGKERKVSLIGSTDFLAESPKVPAKFSVQPATFHLSSDTGETGDKTETKQEQKTSCFDKICKYIDFTLCQNPIFLLLAGSVMMMAVGMPHCLFFLPTYAVSVGIETTDASILLSLSALFDLGGRLCFGFLLDLNLFPKYLAYSSMMLLAGLAAICLPSATSFTQITVCMACYGVGTGSWFLMVPLLLAELLGVERIASSYGLVRLFQSITNLSGPMVSGLIYSNTGTLGPAFYFMGSSMLLGGLSILFLPLAIRFQSTRK